MKIKVLLAYQIILLSGFLGCGTSQPGSPSNAPPFPLHEAAKREEFVPIPGSKGGQIRLLEKLLKEGKNPNELNDSGETPLHVAVKHDYAFAADILARYKADINEKGSSLEGKRQPVTALELASDLNKKAMLDKLIFSFFNKNKEKAVPHLISAIETHRNNLATILIRSSLPDKASDLLIGNKTPITVAIENDCNCIDELFSRLEYTTGILPLGDPPAACLALKKGNWSWYDKLKFDALLCNGKSPRKYAQELGLDPTEILKHIPKDTKILDIAKLVASGPKKIDAAISAGKVTVGAVIQEALRARNMASLFHVLDTHYDFLKDTENIFVKLVDKGVDDSVIKKIIAIAKKKELSDKEILDKNSHHYGALISLINNGVLPNIELFTNIAAINRYANTAQQEKDLIELLINKVGIDLLDSNHMTPLMSAAFGAKKDVVEILLANGASLKSVIHGTPLHYAARITTLGSPNLDLVADVIEMLLKKGGDKLKNKKAGIMGTGKTAAEELSEAARNHPRIKDLLL